MEPLDRPAPAPRTPLVDDRAGVERAEASRAATVRWDWSPLWIALVYAVLAVIWFYLLRRYISEGPLEHDAEPAPPAPPDDADVAPLSFAY